MLVRTTALSLNFRDKLVLENGMGMPLSFPFVPGSDMAGVVEAVGRGVTRFQPGDRVISVFDPTWIDGQKPERPGTSPHWRSAVSIRVSLRNMSPFPKAGS